MATTGTPRTLTLRQVRTLRAPPEIVFQALINPSLVARWLGPEGSTTTVEHMEARVGGQFSVRIDLPGGPTVRMRGIYRTIEPPNALAFTWAMQGSEDPLPQVVTFRLAEDALGTRLHLIHEGFVDRGDLEQNRAGWDHLLDRLDALIAGS